VFGDDDTFEDAMRSLARELGNSIERAMEGTELDDIANMFGLDPAVARRWVDEASGWLRLHAEDLGAGGPASSSEELRRFAPDDQFRAAAPHPLDLPTEAQGVALAALDSGRWTLEPGTEALTAKGDGPGPTDALGIVRELTVRDWISVDGKITLAGRNALSRWLGTACSP
jgi:hypothetical protein